MAKDDVLISRAQAGDEQAFTALVKNYHAFVYAIVSGVLDDLRDAEEVVQDAFINAYRGLPQLEDNARFKGWLAEIARNCARDRLRKQRLETVPIDEVRSHTLETSDAADAHLIRDEQRELIRRAMKTLSQKDREIARAYYLDGASYDELIRTHGLSYKAISFRLSRAKRTLTKRLSHLLSGVFIPPATTLKKISSGGFTAMKIGTVPKVVVGVIAIIVLVFIGSHQLLSPEGDSSPSVKVTASTTNKPKQSVPEIDTTRRNVVMAPSRAEEPQISTEEMEQIEDFFAQLDKAEARSEADTPQLAIDAEEHGKAYIDGFTADTKQSAEDVMNAYLTAYKSFDREAMLPLVTGAVKEWVETSLRSLGGQLPDEFVNGLADLMPEEMVDEVLQTMRENVQEAVRMKQYQDALSQLEIVSSEYVGNEFHFQLRMPMMEMSEDSDILHKMRKENGVWRIYDIETFMMKLGESYEVEKILWH